MIDLILGRKRGRERERQRERERERERESRIIFNFHSEAVTYGVHDEDFPRLFVVDDRSSLLPRGAMSSANR